jgi:hypothetical protein
MFGCDDAVHNASWNGMLKARRRQRKSLKVAGTSDCAKSFRLKRGTGVLVMCISIPPRPALSNLKSGPSLEIL